MLENGIKFFHTHKGMRQKDCMKHLIGWFAWLSIMAFAQVVRSAEFKKDLAANYWTADFMGQQDAAEFMEQKYQGFRRALLDIGMAR